MTKVRLATAWLDGCSGCHMSILDMDERLIELVSKMDLVYGPYVDIKVFPEEVDVALVEGAVSSEEDKHKIRMIRERSKILVSLGDCGVTANIPSMRNPFTVDSVLDRGYIENADQNNQIPRDSVPLLLTHARPIHEYVQVDAFIPGCPPPADAIYYAISELLEGRIPDMTQLTRFGR